MVNQYFLAELISIQIYARDKCIISTYEWIKQLAIFSVEVYVDWRLWKVNKRAKTN